MGKRNVWKLKSDQQLLEAYIKLEGKVLQHNEPTPLMANQMLRISDELDTRCVSVGVPADAWRHVGYVPREEYQIEDVIEYLKGELT